MKNHQLFFSPGTFFEKKKLKVESAAPIYNTWHRRSPSSLNNLGKLILSKLFIIIIPITQAGQYSKVSVTIDLVCSNFLSVSHFSYYNNNNHFVILLHVDPWFCKPLKVQVFITLLSAFLHFVFKASVFLHMIWLK